MEAEEDPEMSCILNMNKQEVKPQYFLQSPHKLKYKKWDIYYPYTLLTKYARFL